MALSAIAYSMAFRDDRAIQQFTTTIPTALVGAKDM